MIYEITSALVSNNYILLIDCELGAYIFKAKTLWTLLNTAANIG